MIMPVFNAKNLRRSGAKQGPGSRCPDGGILRLRIPPVPPLNQWTVKNAEHAVAATRIAGQSLRIRRPKFQATFGSPGVSPHRPGAEEGWVLGASLEVGSW